MVKKTPVLTEVNGSTAVLWLNRPEKHNALDIDMLTHFLESIKYLNSLISLRFIVIRGKGNSFCSGADMGWMQRSLTLTSRENYEECEILASCFLELYNSEKIIITQIHGNCMGGGNGFAAASDIVLASQNSVFAFSEVLLGLVPATIMPYVTAKTGQGRVPELMLTGRKFSADEAKEIGLVNHIYKETEASESIQRLVNQLSLGAPGAQRIIKKSLRDTNLHTPGLVSMTAKQLATMRITPEAREGINAFVQKRNPVWEKEML